MCKFCTDAKKHRMFLYCPYCGSKLREFIPNIVDHTSTQSNKEIKKNILKNYY